MIVEKFGIDKYGLKINKIGKLFVKSRYFVTLYPPSTHTFFFSVLFILKKEKGSKWSLRKFYH